MTIERSEPASMTKLSRLVTRGGFVLAVTDDKPSARLRAVRRAAVQIALKARAGVLLFDRSAVSWWSDPYPSGPFTAEVDGPRGDRPLTSSELDALGRHYLLDQVREIQAEGVRTLAWLPRRIGPAGIQQALDHTSAGLVLIADESRTGRTVQGIIRRTLDYYAAGLAAPLAAISETGDVRVVAPHPGSRRPPFASRASLVAHIR